MIITKEIEIDMAHRVPNHKSKCRNLHGHRYKIEVGVDDKIIDKKGDSSEGMVIDFSDLKEIIIREIDNRFDHGAVFYKEDKILPALNLILQIQDQDQSKIHFVDFIPTAENLAKYWFGLLEYPLLKEKGIKLSFVKVFETPTSTALYSK